VISAVATGEGLPNKRFEQTNHGHDSKLRPKCGGAVVCSSTAVR